MSAKGNSIVDEKDATTSPINDSSNVRNMRHEQTSWKEEKIKLFLLDLLQCKSPFWFFHQSNQTCSYYFDGDNK